MNVGLDLQEKLVRYLRTIFTIVIGVINPPTERYRMGLPQYHMVFTNPRFSHPLQSSPETSGTAPSLMMCG